MALLDRVPGHANLYIGGLFTLRRREALQQAKITHVLSVLRTPLDSALFASFAHHMVVEVDDVDDENLLEHFTATNAFIRRGLDAGGAVFVHCAMGKSRSAAVVIAYLLQQHNMTPSEALTHLRQARPICEPNQGFIDQLNLYHQMHAPDNIQEDPTYQRWLYHRERELSRACGQAPEPDKIRFEDEHADQQASAVELRCRKCRRPLATSQYLVMHGSASNSSPSGIEAAAHVPQKCAHYFLDPLSWMRPELELGKLEGRLECPKCHTNVGKYAWQGMRCSCSEWVVPGITLSKGRIDEARKATFGIRHPPDAPVLSSPTSTPSKQNL